jgi:DNA-binding MarR family transcriptional regulator
MFRKNMTPSEEILKSAFDTASQLHRSALRLSRQLTDSQGVKGTSLSKLGIMGRLYREGPSTATELAAYMRIQPQSLTRLIADLKRCKWIISRPHPVDRRQNLLELTDAGAMLLVKAVHVQQVALAQAIISILTPAEQEMLRLAAGLMDRLATATEAGILPPKKQRQRKK